jgi:translation elongation factor EF-1beta
MPSKFESDLEKLHEEIYQKRSEQSDIEAEAERKINAIGVDRLQAKVWFYHIIDRRDLDLDEGLTPEDVETLLSMGEYPSSEDEAEMIIGAFILGKNRKA